MTRTKQNEKKRQNHQKNDYYGNVFKLPLSWFALNYKQNNEYMETTYN